LLIKAISLVKTLKAKSIKLHAYPFAEVFYLTNGSVKVKETEYS
jgi:hypothetical protein